MDNEISDSDRAILQQLEEELWLERTRFDRKYMEKILADDFFEFGRSGRIHNRENCLSHASGTIDAVIPLPNLAIRLLTADVAQVTYDSEVAYGSNVEKSRRSSIWSKTNEQWQLRFHQGTAFDS